MRLLHILLLLQTSLLAQVRPMPNAHSHNDYEQDRPLLNALEQGFTVIEADVFLIDGELYVAHVWPVLKRNSRTLKDLYLNPLRAISAEKGGPIFPGYSGYVYLMIDVKTNADTTYKAILRYLEPYRDLIAPARDSVFDPHKPVKVFLSGNRPKMDYLIADSTSLVALDGRPEDLRLGIPPALMPVVSTPYKTLFSWKGEGKVNPEELACFQGFVRAVHLEGKKVRLWGTPDAPAVWKLLLDEGVDLINTDRLKAFREWMLGRN